MLCFFELLFKRIFGIIIDRYDYFLGIIVFVKLVVVVRYIVRVVVVNEWVWLYRFQCPFICMLVRCLYNKIVYSLLK